MFNKEKKIFTENHFSINPVWMKVISFSILLLLVMLSDAILSYWIPNFLEDIYQNVATAGIIMSFSSVVGLFIDLIFPQVIKGITVRKLIIFSIVTNLVFCSNLVLVSTFPWIVLVLSAMAIWGLYYELMGFAQHQFVAESIPLKLHSGAWGILGIARSIAYFSGPIIGANLFSKNSASTPFIAGLFSLSAFLVLIFIYKGHDGKIFFEFKNINLFSEMVKWKTLFLRVWPILIVSVFLGLIDAFFWTTGAIWNQTLSESNKLGGLFLPFYTLPEIIFGVLIANWQIAKGKKRKAIKLFLAASLILSALFVSKNIYWQLSMVLLFSSLLSIVYPLIEGVYSDIVERMGIEKRHMIGLTNSTTSLSYIIGPALAGIIASRIGEMQSLSLIGILSAIVCVVLLLAIPKKLKLPQNEIKKW